MNLSQKNMRIGVDARCLLETRQSGVGEYTANILVNILNSSQNGSQKAEIILFSNSWKGRLNLKGLSADQINVRETRFPNKVFNLLQAVGLPLIDQVTASQKIDRFWLPNLNFFNSNKPKVMTVHDLSYELYPEFFSPKMRLWHKLIGPAKLFKQAANIIAVSQNTANDLVKIYGINPSNIKVVHSGVSDEFFQPVPTDRKQKIRAKYGLTDNFILYLGTVEPRKNLSGLMQAFEIMKRKGGPQVKEADLVIAGGWGWLYEQTIKARKKNPYKDQIKFIGYVDLEERRALYQLAKIFVFPSFYEGFGFPPLEAIASKTPVIASFAGSLGEILGNEALLIDPYNVTQLAQAMNDYLENPPGQKELEKSAQIIKEKYSWARAAKETYDNWH